LALVRQTPLRVSDCFSQSRTWLNAWQGFKSEELAKNRVEIILYMMQKVLADRIPGVTMAIHDIRSGKFITPTTQIPDMEAMLKGEAAFIETVWNSL